MADPKKPDKGTWRPGERVSFDVQGKWPFAYGSDLHLLWGWGLRIHNRIAANRPPSIYEAMIFRPDHSTREAMMRLSVTYPLVIRQITECLDFTEKKWTALSEDGYSASAPSADAFWGTMHSLTERLGVACETIATAEASGQQNGQRKKIVPDNPDVPKLAQKIKAELPKGGTMKDIAREFAEGDEKKAESLLRQLRGKRYKHLLG